MQLGQRTPARSKYSNRETASTCASPAQPPSSTRSTIGDDADLKSIEAPTESWPPTIVVIIDTEEEFDWQQEPNSKYVSVTNVHEQTSAQLIFDKNNIIPTYVVDYPVATTPSSVRVLRTFLEEGRCDIGAHLHPWVNPPINEPLNAQNSYPGNLPPSLERQKLRVLTQAIVENFGHRPVVYKAGRYGIGPSTPAILRELRYVVDSSVVPYTDFSADGGPDFTCFSPSPFKLAEGVIELPLSVHFTGLLAGTGLRLSRFLSRDLARRLHLAGAFARLGLLQRLRLTPEGYSLDHMMRQTRAALDSGTKLFVLTYHSSSLKPGATAYARDKAERDKLLTTLENYIGFFMNDIGGRSETAARVAEALLQPAPGRTPSSAFPR